MHKSNLLAHFLINFSMAWGIIKRIDEASAEEEGNDTNDCQNSEVDLVTE